MNETAALLNAFIDAWRAPLETHAEVIFKVKEREGRTGTPVATADGFVADLAFAPIGFDWEMLDPLAEPDEPRSALGAFADALTRDLVMRSEWLGEARSLECGRAFVDAFGGRPVTILTNHIVGDAGKSEGWFPISTATFEWAFVGYDDQAIALLLLTAED